MSKMRKVYDDDKDNCRQLTLIKTRNVSDTYMPPWCKIQNYYLYVHKALWIQNFVQGRTEHTKIRVKTTLSWSNGQKARISESLDDLKHWSQKSGLTLTYEHVTWKSKGIIYFLAATPELRLVLIKWRGQKILSGQHSGMRIVVWPWPLNMWPENQ